MSENDRNAHDMNPGQQEPGDGELGQRGRPNEQLGAGEQAIPSHGVPPAQGQAPPGQGQPGQVPPGVGQPGQGQPAQEPHGYDPMAPSPWSAHGAQAYGQAAPGLGHAPGEASEWSTHPAGGPAYPGSGQPGGAGPPQGTATYPTPPAGGGSGRRGSGRLVAGVAVLALLVGGAAGGVGGYVASDSANPPAVSALDSDRPAKQTGDAPEGSVEAVAKKVTPSVVQLKIGSGEGSGFVLSSDGYIMTNNHVVEAASQSRGMGGSGQINVVFQNGNQAPAKVVGGDPTTDVAVIKVDNVSGLTPVDLGRSDDLQVGQGVVAIGTPYELSGTVTSGIISALHRPVRAGGGQGSQTTVMDAVQTDAAINPGNSGGPLVNMAGQIVGINSAVYSPQSGAGGLPGQQSEAGNVGIGFAIPIDQARRTADDIINQGHATQTYIGATVTDAPQGGALIRDVEPDSPAQKAGLKAGDVVTKLDDRKINDSDALVAAIRTRAPDEQVKMTVGDSQVDVTLGGQPVPTR